MGKERSNFSGKIGFVLAAAGSAVGLGNIWRFRKMFVLLHSLLRNQTFLKAIKKEFFERFYINRQVVQEVVLDYTLLYIGSMKELGKRNEPSSN